MSELTKILNDAGYQTVEGIDAIKSVIQQVAVGNPRPLCCGFKIFPDGKKCEGCDDCAGEHCPICGAKEIDAYDTPATVYACGSFDYDQRPGTFTQGVGCPKKEG